MSALLLTRRASPRGSEFRRAIRWRCARSRPASPWFAMARISASPTGASRKARGCAKNWWICRRRRRSTICRSRRKSRRRFRRSMGSPSRVTATPMAAWARATFSASRPRCSASRRRWSTRRAASGPSCCRAFLMLTTSSRSPIPTAAEWRSMRRAPRFPSVR